MDYDNKGYITIKDLRKYFKVKSSNFYLTCFESTNVYAEFPLGGETLQNELTLNLKTLNFCDF